MQSEARTQRAPSVPLGWWWLWTFESPQDLSLSHCLL